jgi:hypothetical protein
MVQFMNMRPVEYPSNALLDFSGVGNALTELGDTRRALEKQSYDRQQLAEQKAYTRGREAKQDRLADEDRLGQHALNASKLPKGDPGRARALEFILRRHPNRAGLGPEYLDPDSGLDLIAAEYGKFRDPQAEAMTAAELAYKQAQTEKLRQPDQPALPSGYRWKADGSGMEPIPGGPATQPAKKSVTELKQIHAADDDVLTYDNSINTLNKAKSLIIDDPKNPANVKNGPMAYEGAGSGVAGYIGSRVPGGSYVFDEKRAKATDEYSTIMNMEAIKAMSETLKGATTNYELQEFVRILADPSQPREIRVRTIDRMLTLLNNRKELARRRAEEIRSGEYYRPEAGGAGASGIIDFGDGFSVEIE